MIKSIRENKQYIEATNIRSSLSAALDAAKAEESRLLSALAAAPAATDKLKSALDILENKPTVRVDQAGMNRSLAAVRENIEVLTQGLEEQNRLVAELAANLSAQASAGVAAAHGEAAQGIADALRQLQSAIAKEVGIRRDLVEAGYRCNLPALAMPYVEFEDPQSPINRYLKECQQVATDAADTVSGEIDKPRAVHFLVDLPGHRCGDVAVLPGREARVMVRTGRAEYSNEKPRKAQQSTPVREKVWS